MASGDNSTHKHCKIMTVACGHREYREILMLFSVRIASQCDTVKQYEATCKGERRLLVI